MAVIDKEDYHFGSFSNIVRRWATVAAEQLRDTYQWQHIYRRGGSPAIYEVWHHSVPRKVYEYDKPYRKGQKRRRRLKNTFTSWGWYQENELRRMRKQQNPNVDYWFSTGDSYNQLDVTTHDLHEDPEMFIVSGEVRFHTTMHLLYAEAGVGKTGPNRKRAAKGTDIDVQRSAPYKARKKYVGDWNPSEGDTHRPSTKQQVRFMARRMRWLGNHYFNFKLNTWITATLSEFVETQKPLNIGGIGFTIEEEK